MQLSNSKQEYTVDYISGVMSLRHPQTRSLEILSDILINHDRLADKSLEGFGKMISDRYQIFRSFEHNYPALTFALSMGVGKTKLMGAFITYLYTNRNIKNYFVVAPSLTIYEKLQNDLGNPSNDKYVFNGVGCFSFIPNIISGENYDSKTAMSLNFGDINIFIFNNAKFNRETANINDFSEILGQSYFEYLTSIEDLVVILDESHHYRNNATGKAIDALKPFLSIELTGTPHINLNGQNINFQNVVYDYPMAKAIEDGYTKTPFAMTRRDLIISNFTAEQLDILMLKDGIEHHENIKEHLKSYSLNYDSRLVKPFLLVVCRNTSHADQIVKVIRSQDFFDGRYAQKVISIHSNQGAQEKDDNIKLLLDVEKSEDQNPIEIVVHVDILKEGWDVNNLYTIVPLRTASSRVLRMQTVGRGLRLPYGFRTGDKLVDSLTITAHDRFEEIVEEAQDPNGIFRSQNLIFKEDEPKMRSFQTLSIFDILDDDRSSSLFIEIGAENDEKASTCVLNAQSIIRKEIAESIMKSKDVDTFKISKVVTDKISEDLDLYEKVKLHQDIFQDWINNEISVNKERFRSGCCFIPEIMIHSDGETHSYIKDFELDCSALNFAVVDNEILIRNLIDLSEIEIIKTHGVDFLVKNPYKFILEELNNIPEIDYEGNAVLINKVIHQLLEFVVTTFGPDQLNHILVYNKKSITKNLANQLIKNTVTVQPELIESIVGFESSIISPRYNFSESSPIDIYMDVSEENIRRNIFTGFKKSIHLHYKFDSNPEKIFAIICETDRDVIRWMRPAPLQFKLYYGSGKRYQPDFVVETNNSMYLVEIKGEDRIVDPDVIQKKQRAISYCKLASAYSVAHGFKPWSHLFIPASVFSSTTSFQTIINNYLVK